MSKLDNILKQYGESLTGYELTDFWSSEKQQIKDLMLSIYSQVLQEGSVAKMSESFRKIVGEL